MRLLVSFHFFEFFLVVAPLAGCAIPATQVEVPTQSMSDALRLAFPTQQADPSADVTLRRSAHSLAPPGAPQPLLAAPDVRMAYLYEWVDIEGNKHFGGWVAIPLVGFNWVMTDGSTAPLGQSGVDARQPQIHR
jgi:hypothetical protein